MSHAKVLAAGLALAATGLLLTHPVAAVLTLALAAWFTRATGAHRQAPWLPKAALGIGVAVLVFNGLFSWNGATVLYRAPFRIAMLGRPTLTLEAIQWGAVAGVQIAISVLALGAATLVVPPEALQRALVRIGAPTPLARAGALALRLVPDTTRDAEAMRQALATRGQATDGLRGASQVLVPLTARSLDRAQLAEEALVMRGYHGQVPSRRGHLPAVAWTSLATAFLALVLALWGPGRPAYYPVLDLPLTATALVWVLLPVLLTAWLVREVARC